MKLLGRQLILVLIVALFGIITAHSHKCHHDEISKTITGGYTNPYPKDSKTGRILAGSLHNFRIMIDYSLADTFISANAALTSLYQMSKRVLSNTKKYFETYLQITTPDKMTLASKDCGSSVFTVAITEQPVDLYVIIKTQNDATTSYFAAASTCEQDATTKRPVSGVYFLNFASMKGTTMYEYFYFTTYTHEFMHIIFFSAKLFKDYRDPANPNAAVPDTYYEKIDVAGKDRYTKLKYPNLVAFAKKYYRCDTLTYVPLEDGGGEGTAGSHWEKTFFPEDIMNPTIENPARISPFTVEMIKASGWYTVVGDMASYYDWGKDDGCVLTAGSCPTSYEYCPSGTSTTANICSTDFMGKSTCSNLVDYFGTCLLKRKMEVSCVLSVPDEINGGAEEINGPHSRCLLWHNKQSDQTAAECHPIRCVDNELQFKLKSNVTKTCSYPGQIISFSGQWQIKCPDPLYICNQFANRCPMDCNGKNGYCLNGGKCFCFTGYSGPDCGTCDSCKAATDTFVLSSNLSGTFVAVDVFDLQANSSYLLSSVTGFILLIWTILLLE
jgi:leishmanolysin